MTRIPVFSRCVTNLSIKLPDKVLVPITYTMLIAKVKPVQKYLLHILKPILLTNVIKSEMRGSSVALIVINAKNYNVI